MVISSGRTKLTEGEDYTLKFTDNTKCGIAALEICDPEGNSYEPAIVGHFGIKPQKAEILSAAFSDGNLLVTVKDQWESGISGYEVEYREKGSEEWKTVRITEGTSAKISVPGGVSYEIRVHAFADTENAVKDAYNADIYYGDYSETAAVSE